MDLKIYPTNSLAHVDIEEVVKSTTITIKNLTRYGKLGFCKVGKGNLT